MNMKQQRAQEKMQRQMQKIQQAQLDEDKMTADFYETQNRLMTEQKKYYKNVKWYGKWVEKVWTPYMEKKQAERERMAKARAEVEDKARKAMAAKNPQNLVSDEPTGDLP